MNPITVSGYPRCGMYGSSYPARAAIVTCMDPRLQIPEVLSTVAEETFILRNVGGRVTRDILHDLVFCTRVLNVAEVGIIHHTDCRLQQYTREELVLKAGKDIDIKPFSDLEESILEDMRELGDYGIL